MDQKDVGQVVDGQGTDQGEVDNSKRNIMAALMGSLGVAALAGCTNEVGGDATEFIGRSTNAVTGTTGQRPVRWCQSIGTHGSPLELRSTSWDPAPWEGDVMVVEGFWEAGDGGGGIFYWDYDSTEDDDGGTIICPEALWGPYPTAPHLPGKWKRIYSGPLNVKWFGAKGDETTPDTWAIQRTIGAGIANEAAVYFPPGSYRLEAPILIANSYLRVIGSGRQGTRLVPLNQNIDTFRLNGSLTDLHFCDFTIYSGAKCFYISGGGLDHSRFERLTLVAFSQEAFDITAESVKYCVWDQIQINGIASEQYGIRVRPIAVSTDRPGFNANSFRDMAICGMKECGVELNNSGPAERGPYSVATLFSRVTFEHNDKEALRIHAWMALKLDTCWFENNGHQSGDGSCPDIAISGTSNVWTATVSLDSCFFSDNTGALNDTKVTVQVQGDNVRGPLTFRNCAWLGYRSVLLGTGHQTPPNVLFEGNLPYEVQGERTQWGGVPHARKFRMNQGTYTDVEDALVRPGSFVYLTAVNAAAAALLAGPGAPYVSSTAQFTFRVSTADSQYAADGTEEFNYLVVN